MCTLKITCSYIMINTFYPDYIIIMLLFVYKNYINQIIILVIYKMYSDNISLQIFHRFKTESCTNILFKSCGNFYVIFSLENSNVLTQNLLAKIIDFKLK